MINLLKANFYKLKKSKVIWISSIFSVVVAYYFLQQSYKMKVDYGSLIDVSGLIFKYIPLFSLIIVIFTSIFLSFEYQNGYVKNKIIVGHKRIKIYISNLITVFVIGVFNYLIYVMIVGLGGYWLLGSFRIDLDLLLKLINLILIILGSATITNFIIMIIDNEILSPVLNIIITFILFVLCFFLLSCLSETKYMHGTEPFYFEEKEQPIKDLENPKYIKGIKRKIYIAITNTLPVGQALEVSRNEKMNLSLLIVNSIGFNIVLNGIGIYIFKYKDLR